MSSLLNIILFIAQIHSFSDFEQRYPNSLGDDDNNLEYSDFEYDLPEFWHRQFSTKSTKSRWGYRTWLRAKQTSKLTIKKKPPAKTKTTKKITKTKKKIIRTTTRKKLDVNLIYFPPIETYEINATATSESKYPWIAKVVHSTNSEYPYVCTAACIQQNIFITAARCLITLKLISTSVIYKNLHFLVKVFVVSDKPTKQLFDDVGLIVVYNNNKFKGKWDTVPLINVKRTDPYFHWFANLNYTNQLQHKVIGYACKKYFHKYPLPSLKHRLTELDVHIDISLCDDIYSFAGQMDSYFVPCYHPCTRQEAKKCLRFHATEGGAVYNFKTKTLLGVATWGFYSQTTVELPVGISVPNSDNFHKDLACAKKIRDNKNNNLKSYQSLC